MNEKKKKLINQCITIGLAYIVVLGMNLKLLVSTREQLKDIMQDAMGERGFLAIGLMYFGYLMLKPIVIERKVLLRKLDVLLSMVIAFFILVGKSFVNYSSFYLFTANIVQVLKCILIFAAYSIFISVFISYVRHFIGEKKFVTEEKKETGILYFLFEKHPFLTPFLVIMILWLPILLVFYPGLVMGDTVAQIFQAFNLPNNPGRQVVRPNPDIWVTNQHPVLHTALIGVCMRIGQALVGSYNFGYFIYTFLQTVSVAATIAYAIAFLTKIKTSYALRISVFAFYIIHPFSFTYAILGTKDTFFTCFFLIWLITIVKMIYDKNKDGIERKDLIVYFLSLILSLLLRKNAYYMLLISIPFLAVVLKRMRKVLLVSFFVVIAVQSLYTDGFLKGAQIADGSPKDMFSIPFQQTARYIRTYEDEVTEEEKAAINGVLDYEVIKEVYDPLKSDAVKRTYKDERTDEEFQAYVKAWFGMFLKHPLCYIEATVENTYAYYCFLEEPVDNWSYTHFFASSQQEIVNKKGFDIHFVEGFELLRTLVTRAQQILVSLPILSNVMQCAMYMWITIFVALEYVKKKRFKEFGLYLPILLLLGTCILSPVNGVIYFRYVYPIAFVMPVLLAVSLRYKDE